jgi:hypothetical protein
MSKKYSYYVSYSYKSDSGFGYAGNVIDSFSKLTPELICNMSENITQKSNLKECVILNIVKLDSD